ncbi:MGMT family protein [Dichomitus squalens]|uniref:MGMT family protein n=2 Tax=Dichomitus squalens TaxID=114155 RepID=A0A4V2K6M7_9APHY|nr:MGMT family protein [Dichomitus squalens LYAD-421 SS1]EJF56060.1 MGMT family protein [Dichomitus squalens LYAD-421 SS1]TBU21955.1 MGMT family protein [Dichomitus squalens]TBU41026.1 MGMT family protein [Dichomitus squalens]TBU52843.1 MGMT family protein [Dichomitus squalens]
MDGDWFHTAVYHVVRQIPPQRVTSYGHVAKLIGKPAYSRHVGQALKFLSPDAHPPVPWHRVVSSTGAISSRGPGTDGATRQRDALVAEGVDVVTTRSGELKIDLREYGWFPAPGTVDIGVERDEEEGSGGERDEQGAD